MSIPDRLGDFRIVEEIGRGGFGVVYRAQQESLDRPVALKVLYQHRVHTEEEVGRFEREARAAARLDHSGIVSVYAWGQDGTDFYIAQKLVGEGRTVADELQVLKAGGDPPKGYFRRVAGWLASVAEGLQHAHERGIVHRDVKPSNVLLDDDDRPFLGDFGLAKVEDGLELSRTGDFAGSPYYMSPEQADSRRGQVDHRADIYALGVTLYELLTLQPPFQGQSSHEIIRKILTEEPRRPSRIEPRVPADLETICLKAMEKSRVHRYQSAEAFAHDLQCFLDGEPITAAPPSTVSRIVRGARRHRTKVGMVALSLALVSALYWTFWTQKQNQAKADRSETTRLAEQVDDQALQQVEQQLDSEMQEAISEGDVEQIEDIQNRRRQVREFLQEGSNMIVGLLPDIGDSEVVRDIGAAMQDQMLVGGMQAVQEFLATQKATGATDETQDERLAAVSSWISEAQAGIAGFDLSSLGLVTPPVAEGEEGAEGEAVAAERTRAAPAAAAPSPLPGGENRPPVPAGIDATAPSVAEADDPAPPEPPSADEDEEAERAADAESDDGEAAGSDA